MGTRIEQIEERAVEQFNTHMETVLDLLEYENLDRIWIERIIEVADAGDGVPGFLGNCVVQNDVAVL